MRRYSTVLGQFICTIFATRGHKRQKGMKLMRDVKSLNMVKDLPRVDKNADAKMERRRGIRSMVFLLVLVGTYIYSESQPRTK